MISVENLSWRQRLATSSIRTRLLLMVLALSIPLSCMVAYDIYREMQEKVAHTKTSLRTLVQMMVSNTGGKIEHARRSLELLAERPLVKRMSPNSCDPALHDFHYLSPEFANVVYTDLNGVTVCSAVEQPDHKQVDVGATAWFRKFLELKRFTVGSPHFGPITGKWVSVLSSPVYDNDRRLVGAIHLPLDLSAYDPGIPSQYLPKGSRYGFIDKSGVLIWRNQDPDHSIGRLPRTDTGRAIVRTMDGELVSTPADGIPRFYSVKPVPGTDWIAFVGVPVSTIHAEARAVAWRAAMLALSLMATLTLLAFRIARSITKPIAGLAKVAHAVHGDASGIRAAVTGPPEVATVAREFNAMLDSLGRQDAQLRAFLNNSAVIAWLQDHEGRYVFVSNNFLSRLKLTAGQVIGKTNYEILPRELAEAYRNNDQEILRSGRPMEFIEQGLEPDGTVSWWLSHKFLFEEPGGKRFLGGLCVDITKRKQLENQLIQSQKMEAIGQLAGGIAHDFNNILTVIIGYANLLGIGELSSSQSDAANRIIDASEKAAQLTRGLLAFSRKQVLNARDCDLNAIVRHVQTFLARIIGEDIQLRVVGGETAIPVHVDAGQIEQVLINLAANARDAMPAGGELTIETGTVEIVCGSESAGAPPPGDYAFVSVSDTGVGMDEETRRRIFEPFFTTKDVGKGTGLGMSIVYGIVQQHNGIIDVSSEPGQGTTFRILLPRMQGEMGVQEEAGDAVQEDKLRGDETVLLAEDEASVRGLVTKVLNRYGYRVLQSEDGNEAVQMFSAHRDEIDLVIMDMIMPGMNGKAAYEAIGKVKPGTRVLYLSGYTADFIKNRGVSEEEIDLVMKPVQPAQLVRKVRELLDS